MPFSSRFLIVICLGRIINTRRLLAKLLYSRVDENGQVIERDEKVCRRDFFGQSSHSVYIYFISYRTPPKKKKKKTIKRSELYGFFFFCFAVNLIGFSCKRKS